MDINKKVGLKIRDIRKEKGISQLELANKIGVSQAYITYLENGQRNIDLKMLEKIAKALDVSIEELMNIKNIELNEDALLKHLLYKKFKDKKLKKELYTFAEKRLKRALEDIDDLLKIV